MKFEDKFKEYEIGLVNTNLIKLSKRMVVMEMAEQDSEFLNSVYREISEKLGSDVALEIYKMFKGQQICFPVRFLNSAKIHRMIAEEYDGTNLRILAAKYNYSEKTIRRIVKKSLEK